MKHHVERTSPKGEGQKFIGKCILCGATGLPANAALLDCPNNRKLTKDEAMIEIIDGVHEVRK